MTCSPIKTPPPEDGFKIKKPKIKSDKGKPHGSTDGSASPVKRLKPEPAVVPTDPDTARLIWTMWQKNYKKNSPTITPFNTSRKTV
jgi:hypothetical protein